MRLRRALLAVSLALGAVGGQARADSSLVATVRDADGRVIAEIDWATHEIRAVGRARRQGNVPRSMVERAAILDAYANLGLASREARVDAARRVADLPDDDLALGRFLVSYVRGAAIGRLEADGPDWMRLQATAPLYGVDAVTGASGLARFLLARDDVWAGDVGGIAGSTGDYTGVRFEAPKLALEGAIAPVVRDPAGRVVWHVECADRARAEAAGAIEYRDLDAPAPDRPREGERPLVVPVARVINGCDWQVSEADGLRLAPPLRARGGLLFASLGWVRTITPVSPFRLAAVVTSGPEPAAPATGEAP